MCLQCHLANAALLNALILEPATVYPDEVTDADHLIEGACRTVTVNAYERDTEARRKCLAAYGTVCSACDKSLGAVYGPVAEGYIHVHHLRPLSEVRTAHTVDPVEDLRPVYPNCHAVLHRRKPPYSIEEIRSFLTEQQRCTELVATPEAN